jgi:hypothetical protein
MISDTLSSLSVDLTPFIPLSLKERGMKNRKEGLMPLLDTRNATCLSC